MPRFASIDVGSNASRLLIVQAKQPDRVQRFRSMRVPVRLGHAVFQTGRLDLGTIDRCVMAMRKFKAAMEDANVESYRAVVTASARSAKNADELIERVRNEAGLRLDSVDGAEEARLVSLAVQHAMPLAGHSLLMDLGGGSLELTELVDGKRGFTRSLPIGTVRLLEAFLIAGEPVDVRQNRLMREYVDRLLAPHRKKFRREDWDNVVGSGGNLVALAQLCPHDDPPRDVPTIDVEKARLLRDELAAMPTSERAERYSLKADRADVIVPALYAILAVADLAKVDAISVPGVGLKDGIARELVEKHYRVWNYGEEDDKVLLAALQLGRRYHFDERHAMHVAAHAIQLFDATKELHGLGAKSRAMLQVAALLHDIGDFVSPQSHHKHSQYIIDHSDLMGVPPDHRRLISLVARYHRRAHPALRHAAYRGLEAKDRDRVKALAALLRIADGLDRGHRQKGALTRARVDEASLVLEVACENDLALEIWTVERKAELFRETFGRDVRVLRVEPSEPPAG